MPLDSTNILLGFRCVSESYHEQHLLYYLCDVLKYPREDICYILDKMEYRTINMILNQQMGTNYTMIYCQEEDRIYHGIVLTRKPDSTSFETFDQDSLDNVKKLGELLKINLEVSLHLIDIGNIYALTKTVQ